MAKTNGTEPAQTTPKGAEIPVPTREEVFRDLGKVARPRKRRDSEPDAPRTDDRD